jgi:hypothetical protein
MQDKVKRGSSLFGSSTPNYQKARPKPIQERTRHVFMPQIIASLPLN